VSELASREGSIDMGDVTGPGLRAEGGPEDLYTLGYDPREQRRMGGRTASQAAHFVLPYLRTGMRVLDCGCGPGSITIGLATLVAPGEVVGIDVEPRQVAVAQARAKENGIGNVRFEEASAYHLPFPDGAFDAVFAHAVLAHLRHPLGALLEFRRVLNQRGVVGVSDLDWGTVLWELSTPVLTEARNLLLRVRNHTGSPYYARHQRRLLLEAGFASSEAATTATYQTYAGTIDETRRWAATVTRWLQEPAFAEMVVSQKWASQDGLDAMIAAVQEWGEQPDSFFGVLTCSAVGWVGGNASAHQDE